MLASAICLSVRLSAQTLRTITIAGKAGVIGSNDGTAGDAHFNFPGGIVADSSGNIFVADTNNYAIRKISPSGVVTTLAGVCGYYGFADGTGASARFSSPQALTIDSAGNLYVCDNDSTIRKITHAGVVTTVAGSNGQYGSVDSFGTQARFRAPRGLATDSAGNIYVADAGNYQIRKLAPNGLVTTIAGVSFDNGSSGAPLDGVGSGARFGSPAGIVIDASGNLFVSDVGWRLIRKVTPNGVVTTFAGNRNGGGIIDGTGTNAYFSYPAVMTIDPSGDIYVVEQDLQVIRKITANAVVSSVAGLAGVSGSNDGTDSEVRFNWPGGIASDSAGRLFICDTRNYTIRERLPTYAPSFTVLPQNVTVIAGTTAIFTAEAPGTPTPNYQWLKNEVPIPGATAGTLTIPNASATDAGSYKFQATNIAGGTTSFPVTLRVQLPPTITTQPLSQTVTEGQSPTLSVAAASTTTLTYRWQKNGSDIPGANGPTLTLANVTPDSAGKYTAIITNVAGSITSIAADVAVTYARFSNLSVRANAGDSASPLIVGFVVTGGDKPLLVRGIGAALAQFGVSGAMPDPRLLFYQDSLAVASNEDWSASPDLATIAATAARLGAFALPVPSRDAALVRTASAGNYTVWVTAADGVPGNALAEVYDAGVTTGGRLVNLSARTIVDSTNTLIAGFVIVGNTKKRVLLRAVGPGLAALGVPNTLVDPRLTVFQNGFSILAFNDDWNNDSTLSAAAAQVGAFPLPTGSKDAALLLNLDPGAYSAQVTGNGSAAGSSLVEVYEVP